MPDDDNPIEIGEKSWFEYRRLVINELERMNRNIEALRDKLEKNDGEQTTEVNKVRSDTSESVAKLRERLSVMEGKAAAYGAIGGIIAGAIIKFALDKIGG